MDAGRIDETGGEGTEPQAVGGRMRPGALTSKLRKELLLDERVCRADAAISVVSRIHRARHSKAAGRRRDQGAREWRITVAGRRCGDFRIAGFSGQAGSFRGTKRGGPDSDRSVPG